MLKCWHAMIRIDVSQKHEESVISIKCCAFNAANVFISSKFQYLHNKYDVKIMSKHRLVSK